MSLPLHLYSHNNPARQVTFRTSMAIYKVECQRCHCKNGESKIGSSFGTISLLEVSGRGALVSQLEMALDQQLWACTVSYCVVLSWVGGACCGVWCDREARLPRCKV